MLLNKPRLLTPGPTPLPDQVRQALSQDMIHHRKAAFHELMESCQRGLQTIFGTSQPVLSLSCSGTGAMTAAVYGLFEPGDTVIAVNAGKFGERWSKIAASRGLDVVEMNVEWGLAASPEDVEAMLDEHPGAKGLLIQLSETSTGVLHPIREIGEKLKGRDCLFVVDGISGVTTCPCPMDEWGVDCLVTSSQKGFMLPPGLAFAALSERAWERCGRVDPGCFYFNLPAELAKLKKGETNFTSPVNLVQGLAASLELLLSDGLEALFRKQWALTRLCRAGVAAMGLRPFAKTNYTGGLTSVLLPDSVDGIRTVADCAKEQGVTISGGQDVLKGRILRVAHMGWVDWADLVAALYAVSRSLARQRQELGRPDFLETALAAYREALEGPLGVEPKRLA